MEKKLFLFLVIPLEVALVACALWAPAVFAVLDRADIMISIGTFVVLCAHAYYLWREKKVGEESVKVFFRTRTKENREGKSFLAVARIRKNEKNYRFTRREIINSLFLVNWLEKGFPTLERKLGFILTENGEAFQKASRSGTDLNLYCEDHEVFARLFEIFYSGIPGVGEKIRYALAKGEEGISPNDGGGDSIVIRNEIPLSSFGDED